MQQRSCESFCLYISIYIHSKVHVPSYPCPATKYIWVEQSEKLVSHVFCGLEVCFRILSILTQTLTFLKKDIMCSPGCHHLPDRILGTPGIHANYSLLGMCLEHVFELNLFFLFRSLIFSGETEQLEDWGNTVSLTRPLTLSFHHIHAFCSANFPSLQHQLGGYTLKIFRVQEASSLSVFLAVFPGFPGAG